MEEMVNQCTEMMEQMGNMMGNGMMGSGMMGNMMGNTTTWWASPWYWFVWGLLPALLITAVVLMVWVIRRNSPTPVGETPLNILKLRYAQGEVTPEQFETMKRHLAEA